MGDLVPVTPPVPAEVGEHMAKMRATKAEKAVSRKTALQRLTPRAVEVLEEHMESTDPNVSLRAAVKVLEYEWGKPSQPVESNQPIRIVFEAAYLQPKPE